MESSWAIKFLQGESFKEMIGQEKQLMKVFSEILSMVLSSTALLESHHTQQQQFVCFLEATAIYWKSNLEPKWRRENLFHSLFSMCR